jgi:predicted Zn-dependent protease
MGRKIAFTLILLAACAGAQKPRTLKPGFNLFTRDQDVQLGKEAAAQIEKQVTLANNAELDGYVRRIGEKLAATPEAGGFPYTFRVVNDKSINAFALPGGPAFVNSGLLAAAANEAQVAGVLAHEISHVALRHGTNQASKANLIELPAALAAGMLGGGSGSGTMLSKLAEFGIGLGANSVLLKFSRDAERDADLLGTRIMARVGYDPIEMARFFEKLEAEGGVRGPQFLSDHPNPGNRVKAVQAEIALLPRRTYTTGNAREFARMQKIAAALPPPPERRKPVAEDAAPNASAPASIPPPLRFPR